MNGQKETKMALPKLSTLILPHSHFFAYFISILFCVCISIMCPKSLSGSEMEHMYLATAPSQGPAIWLMLALQGL